MAANAPYYQMRAGHFTTAPNSTNATPSRLVSEENEYEAAAAARQTPTDTPSYTMEENHNLADLLEAATTAAGQAAQAMDAHDAVAAGLAAAHGRGKRKRASSSPVDDAAVDSGATSIAPKRRRLDVPTDPQLPGTEGLPPSGESLLNDARAAGVHSAAALFRRSTEKTSRKYTRPPMSKLFMSLQLSPENFLQLQAQAKAYMLDTTYPERQNCVGNRGKGDTDMVKLRLFNCVRDFLNDRVGDEFFGENVEKPGERDAMEAARALGEDKLPNSEERLTWPRDGNKIISLVTPLMRRMVTNERQRMYAIETRKGGAKKKDKEGSVEAVTQQAQQSPSGNSSRGQSIEQQLLPAFDPTLGRLSHTPQPVSPSLSTSATPILHLDMAPTSRMVQDEPLHGTDIHLPSDGPAAPRLNSINIFLMLAPNTTPGGSVKPGIKLSEKRIVSQIPGQLARFPWDLFHHEVAILLTRAKARYPAVRDSRPPATVDDLIDLSDSLQELAAAANAIQSENTAPGKDAQAMKRVDSSITKTTERSTGTMKPSPNKLVATQQPQLDVADHDAEVLPRYVIKTIGPNGWETIMNAEQWGDLLSRRGFDVWTDGVLNMVVELVDVLVPMERAMGGKFTSIGGEKSNGKGKEVVGDEGLL